MKTIQARCTIMQKIKEQGIDRKTSPPIVDAVHLNLEVLAGELHTRRRAAWNELEILGE